MFPRLYASEQRQTHPVRWHDSRVQLPFDPLLGCPSTIVELRTTPSGPAVMFVTMKPTRGNSSPLCHSTLATTRRAWSQLSARYQKSSYTPDASAASPQVVSVERRTLQHFVARQPLRRRLAAPQVLIMSGLANRRESRACLHLCAPFPKIRALAVTER